MARRQKKARIEAIEPTREQLRGGRFELEDVVDRRPGGGSIVMGKAFRRVAMIDILGDQCVISDAELKALKHYRHHADIADRSPLRDSLNKQRGGSGTGPTIEILNATRVRDDCERAAGRLVDILRAVALYDVSLPQWAIACFGSVEKSYTRKTKNGGLRLVNEIRHKPAALRAVTLDFKMAAKRVQAELDA